MSTSHGGKRAGAGRKPDGRVPLRTRVKPETKKQILRRCCGISIGEFLDSQKWGAAIKRSH